MSQTPERAHRTRYHARWVIPASSPAIEHGAVVVEGDRIAWVGPRDGGPPARTEELGDVMLTPGLVNAHTHLDLTALRGFPPGPTFFEWVRGVVAAREQLAPAELLDSARLGIIEGLRAGITTFADTAPNDAPFEAMRELGVRGVAYREVFGPDPAQCDASLAGLRAAIDAMRPRETPLVRAGVSPHAPYSVSDALYRAVADYARDQGLPLATHVAESREESELVAHGSGPFADFLRGRGIVVGQRARTPVALLERCGVLGDRALLIHCVRVDAADIATIAAHRCGVATCPSSNFQLLHAHAPVEAMIGAGCRVGVGSDSMASNHVMDLLWEAPRALGSGGATPRGPMEFPELIELAAAGGARALGLDGEIGSLEVGKQADIAAFDLASPAPSAAMLPVKLVLVAGRPLVRDGRVLAAGAEGIEARVTATATRLSVWDADRRARWRAQLPPR